MEVKLRYRKISTPAPAPVQPDWDPNFVWDEFRKGSELAFTAIYKRYIYDLYHFGERLTNNKQLIEDSIHDLFVELWNRREHYGAVVHLKFYLLKSLKNRMLKNIKLSRKPEILYTPGNRSEIEVLLSSEAERNDAEGEDQNKRVMECVNRLSGREKQAVFLRFYDGLSYEEIASLMSISIRSTYKLMYRALDALKKSIGALSLLAAIFC